MICQALRFCFCLSVFLGLYQVAHAQQLWDVDVLYGYTQNQAGRTSLVGDGKQYASVSKEYVASLRHIRNQVSEKAGIYPKFLISSKEEVNAFATWQNGQAVMIFTLPLLKALGEDRDAIAAIMGHEIAHLKLNHRTSKAVTNTIINVLAMIAGAAIDSKMQTNNGAARGLAHTLVDTGTDLASSAFSRDAETEADSYGVRYMIGAGFNPEGAVRVHRELFRADFSFFNTHPSSSDRVENIYRVAAQLKGAPATLTFAQSKEKTKISQQVPGPEDPGPPIKNQIGVVLLTKPRHKYVIFSGTAQVDLSIGSQVFIKSASGDKVPAQIARSVDGYYSAVVYDSLESIDVGARVISDSAAEDFAK